MESISIDEIIGGTLFDDLLQKIGGSGDNGYDDGDFDQDESSSEVGFDAPVKVFDYLDFRTGGDQYLEANNEFLEMGDEQFIESSGGFLETEGDDFFESDNFIESDDESSNKKTHVSGGSLHAIAKQIASKYLNL